MNEPKGNIKRPYSVGYFSSYDRGLVILLGLWPRVKEKVPEATLDIYYGWDMYDKFHSQNPENMKWKWQMIKMIHQLDGVKENGRVSHEKLAEAMKDIKVLAYPSEFTEINMITMIKVLAAGCIPVTTGVGAVLETQGGFGYTVRCDDIYRNEEKQKEFVDALVKALKQEDYDPKPAQEWAAKSYWDKIARVWDKAMSSHPGESG